MTKRKHIKRIEKFRKERSLAEEGERGVDETFLRGRRAGRRACSLRQHSGGSKSGKADSPWVWHVGGAPRKKRRSKLSGTDEASEEPCTAASVTAITDTKARLNFYISDRGILRPVKKPTMDDVSLRPCGGRRT